MCAVRPAISPAVRCRTIGDADLEDVAALLTRGFPERPAAYWRRGLARQAARSVPDGYPRYGFVLDHGGRLVGVLLTLFTEADGGRLRCNLSSWTVDPDYRAYAGLLDTVAARRKDVTYTNISASPRTWATHEARGFRRFARGQVVALPLLGAPRAGARVDRFGPGRADGLSEAERRLLADHAGYGCLSLVGTDAAGREPFVLVRRPVEPLRRRLGWSPLTYFHLVYCRDPAALSRFGHGIGRHLLRHGTPVLVLDACGPAAGVRGVYVEGRGIKFARGPDPVRLGDLAYTELALFGP